MTEYKFLIKIGKATTTEGVVAKSRVQAEKLLAICLKDERNASFQFIGEAEVKPVLTLEGPKKYNRKPKPKKNDDEFKIPAVFE